MSLFNNLARFVLLLLTLSQLVVTADSATPDQLDGVKVVILAYLNTYRAISAAAPLVWNDTLAGISDAQAMNCSLQYDIFNEGDRGQIVFNLGNENGSFPDIVKGTWLAVEYWWDERKLYHPKSKDYDDLSLFSDSWEFTQMVWASSRQIGCGWSYGLCTYPDDTEIEGHKVANHAQFVCNMVPAGNQWDKFGANVHCIDPDGCTWVQPQTNTIDTATISWPSDLSKRVEPTGTEGPAPTDTIKPVHYTKEEIAALRAEAARVNKAVENMTPEEFIPGFIPNVQNPGKVMAEAGHEGMIREGYDAKYFEHLQELSDTTAAIV